MIASSTFESLRLHLAVCILLLWIRPALAAPAAAAAPEDGVTTAAIEATSLRGTPLLRIEVEGAFRATQEAAVAALGERLRRQPSDADARIWLGRRLGYLGRYGDAIAVFSEGIAQHPGDARFRRHRGHRYLSLRQLDDAVRDLEHGVALIAGLPDRVEPDGLPNLYNQPTSSLKTNLWYHLGVARYMARDLQGAGDAFLACAALADNHDMLVAAAYWRYLALRRQHRDDEAAALLESLPAAPRLIENDDYWSLLRLFRGEVSAGDLLGVHTSGSLGSSTLGYGVGAWHLVEGRLEQARRAFEHVVEAAGWSAFGYLAAEAELAAADDAGS